jgi:cytochrome c peroxidase
VGYGRWFFWDGRADSLWSQALKPLENPREQGFSRLQVAHLLESDLRLRPLYEQVFGRLEDLRDPGRFPQKGRPVPENPGSPLEKAWTGMAEADRLTVDRIFSNVGKALEAYERRLVSRRSPFDVFVEGLRTGDRAKMASLSPSARLGLKIFVGKGNCRLCHSGPTFTDGEFHNLGIPPLRGGPTPLRYGAIAEIQRDPFNGKTQFSDDREAGARKLDYLVNLPDTWGQVKTPGLRNVAKSGPYMHQGQFKTLEEVVQFYSVLKGMLQAGHHERTILLPLFLEEAESAGLVAFLESLTDERIDANLLKPLP